MIYKDESICKIFSHLQEKFGEDEVVLKDHWDADICAIGLANKTGEYLIYISTFGKEENKYYASIEKVISDENHPDLVDRDFDNLSLSELEVLVKSYFKI